MGPVQARRDRASDRKDLLGVVGHAGRSHRHRERGQKVEVARYNLDRTHSRHSRSRLGIGRTVDCTVAEEEADQRGTGAGEEVAAAPLRNLLGTPCARKLVPSEDCCFLWWLSEANFQAGRIVRGRMAAVMLTKASNGGASVIDQYSGVRRGERTAEDEGKCKRRVSLSLW